MGISQQTIISKHEKKKKETLAYPILHRISFSSKLNRHTHIRKKERKQLFETKRIYPTSKRNLLLAVLRITYSELT